MTGMHWGLGVMALGLVASLGIAPTLLATPLKDGIYFYGQSPQVDVLGQEYVVFRAQQQQIRGAIYYPAAEYACFTGHEDDQGLHLLMAAEDGEASPYAIPWAAAAMVSAEKPLPMAKEQLRGYQPIAQLSALAQSLLTACAASWGNPFVPPSPVSP